MLPYASMRLTDEELLAEIGKGTGEAAIRTGRKESQTERSNPRVRSRLSARERKTDTRRKILVGAMLLKLSDQHPETKEFMVKHLDEFLEHPRDRALCLLPTPICRFCMFSQGPQVLLHVPTLLLVLTTCKRVYVFGAANGGGVYVFGAARRWAVYVFGATRFPGFTGRRGKLRCRV